MSKQARKQAVQIDTHKQGKQAKPASIVKTSKCVQWQMKI